MNKFKIVAFGTVVTLMVVATLWKIQFEGSTASLIERFPNIHPDVVRKVHKEMTREALAGEYSELNLTDEGYDAIFLAKAYQYQ